uniref:Acyl-coenzyme A thioesterase 13 n=1 Tax=Caenorhabditis japonica TaxID=281687 RepID=A0A8R1I0D9_CAEJA
MSGKFLPIAVKILKSFGPTGKFNGAAIASNTRAVHAEEGNLRLEFEVEKGQTNNFETLHGGCTATLIDNFTTVALLLSNEPKPHPGVSVDLHVTYLAAAQIGETVVIDATVTKRGKSIAFTKAELYRKRDNTLIATGVHTKAFPTIKKAHSYPQND